MAQRPPVAPFVDPMRTDLCGYPGWVPDGAQVSRTGCGQLVGGSTKAASERDGDLLGRAVARDGQRHLLARPCAVSPRGQLVGVGDRLAVELRDHVARLQAGLVGGAVADDAS